MMMNIQPVRFAPNFTSVERIQPLDCRAEIFALGVITSAIVFTAVQPPIGIILSASILILTVGIVFQFPKGDATTDKTARFANDKITYWRYPCYSEFETPKYLQPHRRNVTKKFPPREPVGERDDNFQNRQRVPVGERDNDLQNRQRVPVGER